MYEGLDCDWYGLLLGSEGVGVVIGGGQFECGLLRGRQHNSCG